MAKFLVASARQVRPHEVAEGWYVTRNVEGERPAVIGRLYPEKADAETEADRLAREEGGAGA